MSVLDPRPWGTPLFAVVFTVVFALAGVRALLLIRRPGHHLHHSVCSAAMVYMAVAMSGAASAHGGHAEHLTPPAAGTPLLTGLLLLYFAGYVLRTGTTLVAVPGHAHGAPRGPLISTGPADGGKDRVPLRHAPEVAAACRVSMALGMFAMLLTL